MNICVSDNSFFLNAVLQWAKDSWPGHDGRFADRPVIVVALHVQDGRQARDARRMTAAMKSRGKNAVAGHSRAYAHEMLLFVGAEVFCSLCLQ